MTAKASSVPPLETGPYAPISHSILGACLASGMSRAAIYRAIKAGELRFVKHGKRTYILHEDLREFMTSPREARAAA